MSGHLRCVLSGGVFAIVMWAATSVSAQDYYGGYGGYWNNGYGPYNDQCPPYFALHPPVYYSYVVPRPYGYSPFPYPPGVLTPEVDDKPQKIHNPYVPEKPAPGKPAPEKPAPSSQTKPTSDATTGGPEVIINPYVVHAQLGLAR